MKNRPFLKDSTKSTWVFATVGVILLSSYPVVYLYAQNAEALSLSEIWLPLAIYVLAGCCFLGVSMLITRSVSMAGVAACIFIPWFTFYSTLESGVRSVWPQLRYWHIVPISVFLLAHVVFLLHKLLPAKACQLAMKGVSMLCAVLLFINTILAIPQIMRRFSSGQKATMIAAVEAKDNLPNFYFFLFDEYAPIDMIEKYYGYDNSAFRRSLEELGFFVSSGSKNDSHNTATVVANLMALDYLATDADSVTYLESLRTNGVFPQMLEAAGYTVIGRGGAENSWGIPTDPTDSSSQLVNQAVTIGGDHFSTLMLARTPLSPFINQEEYLYTRLQLLESYDFFTNADSYSPNSGLAYMAYFQVPHMPFVFTADGKLTTLENRVNYSNPNAYLDQYIFTTKVMLEIAQAIVSNDPSAVVVIQSDHGSRTLYNEKNENIILPDDKRYFFNTVYFQGDTITEIDGLSSVNTLRLILSMLLGVELPPVEVKPSTLLPMDAKEN